MRVEFSALALVELDDILRYIEERNLSAARKLRAFIFLALQRISRFPEAAQRVAERPAVRRLPLVRYPYALYYEIGNDVVTIVRILHTSRAPFVGS